MIETENETKRIVPHHRKYKCVETAKCFSTVSWFGCQLDNTKKTSRIHYEVMHVVIHSIVTRGDFETSALSTSISFSSGTRTRIITTMNQYEIWFFPIDESILSFYCPLSRPKIDILIYSSIHSMIPNDTPNEIHFHVCSLSCDYYFCLLLRSSCLDPKTARFAVFRKQISDVCVCVRFWSKDRQSSYRRRHLISKFPHFKESFVLIPFRVNKQLDFNRLTESV